MGSVSSLALWYSNFQNYTPGFEQFTRQDDITVASDGTFTVNIPVGAFYTISTIKQGPTRGAPNHPIPASQPRFPLPHTDDFEAVEESQEAKLFADQVLSVPGL